MAEVDPEHELSESSLPPTKKNLRNCLTCCHSFSLTVTMFYIFNYCPAHGPASK